MGKLERIKKLAADEAGKITGSPSAWMGFLDTACRIYKYNFEDQVLIHAQRPDVTACAELGIWSRYMNNHKPMRARKGADHKKKPLVENDGLIVGNRIAIRRNIPSINKACILAEELGHY